MRSNDAASITPHAHALAREVKCLDTLARLLRARYGNAPSADAHAMIVVSANTVNTETCSEASACVAAAATVGSALIARARGGE